MGVFKASVLSAKISVRVLQWHFESEMGTGNIRTALTEDVSG